MKKIIIIFFLIIILYVCYDLIVQNNKMDIMNYNVFCTKVTTLYKGSINNYKPGITYYKRVNNKSCGSDFNDGYDYQLNYYIKFDSTGNVEKLIAYDDYYQYESKKNNITIEDLLCENNKEIRKRNNFSLKCEKKDNLD